MKTEAKKFNSVEEYISTFPEKTALLLETLRKVIKEEASEAEEVISYNMPAYKWNGILVYFAGYSRHIGFYPTGSGIEAFQKELSGYKWSKGAVQFPLDQTLPLDLVRKMVRFRIAQNKKAGKWTIYLSS